MMVTYEVRCHLDVYDTDYEEMINIMKTGKTSIEAVDIYRECGGQWRNIEYYLAEFAREEIAEELSRRWNALVLNNFDFGFSFIF